MISIFFLSFRNTDPQRDKLIEKKYFSIAVSISLGYILLLTLIMLSYTREHGKILDYYRSYNIFLSSVQALVTASIGAFFINNEKEN
jgi:multisubunit Na+/H+ antiporter MnhB subunit